MEKTGLFFAIPLFLAIMYLLFVDINYIAFGIALVSGIGWKIFN